MSISRLALVIFAAMFLVLGGYTAAWYWLASDAESRIEAWRASLAEDGVSLTYEALNVSGFPDRLAFEATAVRAEAIDGSWTVKIPVLDAFLSPFDFRRINGMFSGRGVASVFYEGVVHEFAFDTLRNAFVIDPDHVDVDMTKLNLRHAPGDELLLIDHVAATFDRRNPQLKFRLDNMLVPKALESPFGPTFGRVAATITVTGAPLPRAFTSDTVRAWSNAGGALDLSDIDFRQRPLDIRGSGTVALDNALQPIGAVTFRIAGYSAALDRLIARGVVGETEGRAAKAVMDFLSQRPTGDGPRTVEVPLTLQNGALSVGPVTLLRFRPVNWF